MPGYCWWVVIGASSQLIEGVLLLDIDQIILNASKLFGWFDRPSILYTTLCIVIRSHLSCRYFARDGRL